MWTPPERLKHPIEETHWPSAQRARASRWFSPISLGPLTLRTRTWVPAMVPWRSNEHGEVTPQVIDWYRRFAEGRPGAVVVEATGIRDIPSGPLLRIGHDRYVEGLRTLVEAVHEASEGQTKILIQLIDFLAVKRRPPPEKFFLRFWKPSADQVQALAPNEAAAQPDADFRALVLARYLADPQAVLSVLSAQERNDLERGYRESVFDTHLPHIASLPQVLPEQFANAAERAKAAGFDGVELHYAHAYTMAGFLSRTNVRSDGYGGSLAGRLRLPLEVLAAVRKRVSADYCLGARYLGDEVIEGGTRVEEAAQIGVALARAGADFLSMSKGGKFEDAKQPKVGEAVYPYTGRSGYECMPTVFSDRRGPFGRNLELAATIRRAIRDAGHATPVVGAGGINSFEQAEAALERGDADVIAAARQSLADPDWFLKVERGQGQSVRRCKFTNYCEALDQKHKQVTCQLWDRKGLEAPDVQADRLHRISHDGRRRLIAPPWDRESSR